MRCTSMHSLSSSYTYRAIWLLHTLVKLWVVSVSFLFFFTPLGNTQVGRLTDCHSSQTELQSSRGSWVGWITKQNNSSCRWIRFCPCLCFFFFFSSEEYMCSPVPQSSTMCIMYAIDCCSSPTGLISRSRWRNGCRCSSNQTCNHRYYSYAWRVLKRTISVLYKLGQLKPSMRALWLDSAFRNRTSSFMGWILLSEMVLKWSFTYYDWCVIKYFGGFDISNCRETA